MSVNYTPKTFTAGSPLLATEMNTEVRDFSSGVQGAWTAWTPTLTGFTVGNGSLVARYIRYGKTVSFRFDFTAGSTSTFTSTFVMSLPVEPHPDYNLEDCLGSATMMDASVGTGTRTAGVLACGGGATMFFLVSRLSAAVVGNTNPWTWATSDRLTGIGTYETA